MIHTEIKGIVLNFETNDKVFSPSKVDMGTLSMLSKAEFKKGDRVLDLGCGYGVVGIVASYFVGEENVVMSDNSSQAVQLSKINAVSNNAGHIKIVESDGLDSIDESNFTWILSNPPYHSDFSVAKNFIEKGYIKLARGGKMVMVTKRKEWYKNKLISVFGGVKIEQVNGYYVFTAEKREPRPKRNLDSRKNSLSKKLRRKYEI